MGLTLTETKVGVVGDKRYFIGTATFDSSYLTGGESFTPANAGMTDFDHVSLTPDNLAQDTGLYPIWDDSADKIQLFESGANNTPLDEEASTTDVSAYIVYILALGPLAAV